LNARDKMPFEVTPVYFRLQRYGIGTTSVAGAGATDKDAGGQGDANGAQQAADPEQQ
jgi:hypothetical protein